MVYRITHHVDDLSTGDVHVPDEFTDPAQIIDIVERALLVDPLVPVDDPKKGFVNAISIEPYESARMVYFYDGIFTLFGKTSRKNPAFDKELMAPLRDLSRNEAGEPWRTWILVYNGQTREFHHTFLWAGEDTDWYVIDSSFKRHVAARLNPLDPDLLDPPFSASAAHWLHAAYANKHKIPEDPIIKVEECEADRLDGGWRIYKRADGAREVGALASIADAAGRIVFLVADSTDVTHTTRDVDCHEELLAALQNGASKH